MNRATVASWLDKHGPCTSARLRDVMGVTAKGTPISSHLSSLCTDKYAKKKKAGKVNVFTLTTKGFNWASDRAHEIETVEQINANSYKKGSKGPGTVRLPNTDSQELAISGIVGVIEENKAMRASLERIYLELGQILGK